jgi:Ser/Thr protein kinase RdoA (MazF antagonist)
MRRSAHGAQLARLLRLLVYDGAVDPGAALDGRVTVTDLSRSNPVGLVHVDGCPVVVVKGGTISIYGIDPVRDELAAYRWLSASPDTARLAPVPLLEVAGETAVVTRLQIGAVSLHEALGSGTSTSEALIAELGHILGILHSARAGPRDLPARRPWILDVPGGRAPTIAVGNDSAGRLTQAISQCAPVAAAITRVARAWMSRTIIHGDIKFDNVLVAHDRMLLVDWELAGWGAPVWDLAGIVDGLLIPLCVRGRGEAIDVTLVARLAEPALTAHRRVAGAGLCPTLEELATAVVARLAQTATQLAAMSHDRPDAAEAAPLVLAAAMELASELVVRSDAGCGMHLVIAPTTDVNTQLEEALELLAGCGSDNAVVRAEALYTQWYAQPRQPFEVPPGCPPDLVEMLRAAHVGFLNWEGGWRVENVGPRGQAVVRRGSEMRLLERSDYSPATRQGLLPRPGDAVSVSSRRDFVDPGDGWWRTSGPAWTWTAAPRGMVRLYFNCDVVGVSILVATLTRMLADEPDPWLLKCAVDPAQYARSDVIIAYLTPGAVERRAVQIVEFVRSGNIQGRRDGPPLTLRVAPGLTAAFDPGGDESFGAHRCRLIAEAANGGVQAILARFAADGISPARPWAHEVDPLLPWER